MTTQPSPRVPGPVQMQQQLDELDDMEAPVTQPLTRRCVCVCDQDLHQVSPYESPARTMIDTDGSWSTIYLPFWLIMIKHCSSFWTVIENHEASTKLITTDDDRQPWTVVVGGIPGVVACCWFLNRIEKHEP